MILADKIIALRKKAGWSQEELAEQMNVSRQSVSKWEGAQSMPDMEKILLLSKLFGVSTDYLLKDEIESEPTAEPQVESEPGLRRVTMEEASEYLRLCRENAPGNAVAVFLCVICPVLFMILAALADEGKNVTSDGAAVVTDMTGIAVGVGVSVLLILVAIGVAIFMRNGARVKEFGFLEHEPFETEYGVSGMVKERKREFAEKYSTMNIIATILCILSALPVFAAICVQPGDIFIVGAVCLLIVIAGIATAIFTYAGTINSSMEKLLEEGDYTRKNKSRSRITGAVAVCYWLIVTAVYLFVTFSPSVDMTRNESWIVWAIAGVLFGVVSVVTKLIASGK